MDIVNVKSLSEQLRDQPGEFFGVTVCDCQSSIVVEARTGDR